MHPRDPYPYPYPYPQPKPTPVPPRSAPGCHSAYKVARRRLRSMEFPRARNHPSQFLSCRVGRLMAHAPRHPPWRLTRAEREREHRPHRLRLRLRLRLLVSSRSHRSPHRDRLCSLRSVRGACACRIPLHSRASICASCGRSVRARSLPCATPSACLFGLWRGSWALRRAGSG